ncbi:PREDICTED: BEN domain-containing protein 5-like [Wasmannia auropunctata]|uniref:BEN domain-containing protein 5-like n=1 Tax=Wasmannia auropunctata TaxID=64793 RepID=UPI0005EFD93F|nr:PREDICTED: BEN domain-containing protein 5-like [Wasmannia auropunctata]
MYAYVKYNQKCRNHDEKVIVSVKDIINFDKDDINFKKVHKVKCGKNVCKATLIFVEETREELEDTIKQRRPKICPKKLLQATSDSDAISSTEDNKQDNKKITKKDSCSTNFGREILEKKLKSLTDAQQSNLQHEIKTSNTMKRQHKSIEENSKKTQKDESVKDSESVEGKSKKMKKDETVKNSEFDKENFTYSVDLISNSNNMEFMKNKIAKLEKLNHKLQTNLKNSEIERDKLKDMNYRLQTEILDKFDEWKVSLQNLEKGEISKIESKLASGSKLPVAFVRSAENKIHLGEGIWIRKDTYDDIAKGSKSASVFVKSLAVAVFTPETLQNSSVTGKISAKKKASGEKPRPPLDRKGVSAIKMTLRNWMVKKKYDEAVIDLQCNSVGTYLSHKIDDMTRKNKKASESEKIKMMTVSDPDDVSDVDENIQTSTAREQDTENTEMDNYNGEENAKNINEDSKNEDKNIKDSDQDSDYIGAEINKDSDITIKSEENIEENESSEKEDENAKDNEN